MKTKKIPGYITGKVPGTVGEIPQISPDWSFSDKWNTVKMRCGIGRDDYRVNPGLYALGNPDASSDVFVSANYKLSFDHLRKNLRGFHCWILVLDTKGINVWCAAGKGTFGTKELVNRIQITRLADVVSHRRIILPQLGAPGVAAYEVTRMTASQPVHIPNLSGFSSAEIKPVSVNLMPEKGFHVIYGPVRAKDIPAFIHHHYSASTAMRKVSFTLKERALLIPVDFWYGKYLFVGAIVTLLVLSGIYSKGFSIDSMMQSLPVVFFNILLAYFSGIVAMPILLPWLPARSFALKGGITGIIAFLTASALGHTGNNAWEIMAWFFVMIALSSFMSMNFTGSSTYTSLSGVKKEMKIAVPLQIGFSAAGILIFIIVRIFNIAS
jgi:acetyl-CoA decarbonylase/synthase complex subunit gamma